MGKTLKVLGWLIGMVLLLIIAAVILIPMFVDPNDHKERIVTEVKKVRAGTSPSEAISGCLSFPGWRWS